MQDPPEQAQVTLSRADAAQLTVTPLRATSGL